MRGAPQLEGAVAGANGFSPEEVLQYSQGPAAAPAAAAARAGPLAARSVRASSLAAIQEGAEEAPAWVRPAAQAQV